MRLIKKSISEFPYGWKDGLQPFGWIGTGSACDKIYKKKSSLSEKARGYWASRQTSADLFLLGRLLFFVFFFALDTNLKRKCCFPLRFQCSAFRFNFDFVEKDQPKNSERIANPDRAWGNPPCKGHHCVRKIITTQARNARWNPQWQFRQFRRWHAEQKVKKKQIHILTDNLKWSLRPDKIHWLRLK